MYSSVDDNMSYECLILIRSKVINVICATKTSLAFNKNGCMYDVDVKATSLQYVYDFTAKSNMCIVYTKWQICKYT